VSYQQQDMGNKLRPVLLEKTGQPTIPQIFIGGETLGGTGELFDAYSNGTLQKMLQQHQVSYNQQTRPELSAMLPQWLQPRKSA
jgi:cysteine synthase A